MTKQEKTLEQRIEILENIVKKQEEDLKKKDKKIKYLTLDIQEIEKNFNLIWAELDRFKRY